MSKQDASLKAWIKFEAEDNRPSREMHPSFWFISGYEIAEQSLKARVQELETVIKDHVDRHCPKSYNQSACTWLHDYERLTAVLKQGEKK